MGYPAIIKAAMERLEPVDTTPSNKAPPLHRLAWRAGWALPPPLLASFGFNFALMGVWFGVVWGGLMSLFFILGQGRAAADVAPMMALVAVSGGLLFGVCMAVYFSRLSRRHGLPSWRTFRDGQK